MTAHDRNAKPPASPEAIPEWSYRKVDGPRDVTLKRTHWEIGIHRGPGLAIAFGEESTAKMICDSVNHATQAEAEIQELKRQLAEARNALIGRHTVGFTNRINELSQVNGKLEQELLGKVTCSRCLGLAGKHEIFCPVSLYNAAIAVERGRVREVNGKLVAALIEAEKVIAYEVGRNWNKQRNNVLQEIRAALAGATKQDTGL
jgi:hypothetical protein